MDIISFNEASTANSRIEIINANPDSASGIVTVPKTIASGETITIPAGRVAVLPNVQVDGVINIEGEVFIPSGATFGDLEMQLALKAPILSPAFTGIPTAPTQTAGDNSTKLATTAYVDGKMVLMTAQNSTSGTSINFTGIPSWAKRITVMLDGISTSGTSPIQIQVGSGSVQTTGYTGSNAIAINVSNTGAAIFTTGFGITVSTGNTSATGIYTGVCSITRNSNNKYLASGNFVSTSVAAVFSNAGVVTLSGTLDIIRITTVNGTDTFDAGSINVMYEG